MQKVNIQNLQDWIKNKQVFIDVRSPGEFLQGHLPGAINAPILNDDERASVGKCYKEKGQEAAVKLGHQIVSDENKQQKMNHWLSLAKEYPDSILMCFRGGMRSQIAQKWLEEVNVHRPIIEGGYKVCRQALLEFLSDYCQKFQFLVVSGPTGSAKTHLLHQVSEFWPVLDLEHYANHRGSAFGKMDRPQPQQAVFENHLISEMIQREVCELPFAVEDESRLIGRSVQPDVFFETLRTSEVILLDEPLDKRTENTFSDYILKTSLAVTSSSDEQGLIVFAKYKKALNDIQKKLGGLRTQEIMLMIESSEKEWLRARDLDSNRQWIQALLKDYYDPMYIGSFEKRSPRILFKGNRDQVSGFLLDIKSKKREIPVKIKAIKA